MKVILIKDVARLGRKGEVKVVPDGHALNFLIPRKFAVVATQDGLRRANEEEKKHDELHLKLREEFKKICDVLGVKTSVYPIDANEQGSLFKGVNARDIAYHLKSVEHVAVDESAIKLAHPIKSIGIHEVPLSFDGVEGMCRLEVVKK